MGIAVVVMITVGVTYFSGSFWGRWGTFRGLDEARETLKNLPMTIKADSGDWVAEEEGELDSASVTMLRIQDSYIFRTYKNAATQSFVRVTIMVGPTGIIAVHTPEVCFGGKNYEKEAARTSVPINVPLLSGAKDIVDIFWRVNFVGRSLDTSNRISFYYAVSTGEEWNAVKDPRTTFSKFRYVYKIQVEAYTGTGEEGDGAKKFLTECLPTIHEYLRPYER